MNGESSYSRFLKGDNDALAQIVEKHNKSLVFYLAGILKSVSLAEDAAADAFVEIFVKKPRLKTEEAFCAYLYRTARNKAIDELRRQRRRDEQPIEETELADSRMLEDEVLKKERDKSLHNAIAKLNPDYREALHLVYFENMSYDSAGKVMGKSLKQVTNLVYRGKEALKKILEKEGGLYEEQ
ncbi:MAG: RNA polymerase sigma factor [Ruminococcaceae bacterium]|nr:RNA polymerase sigma factor [Oscillospiraceae bacterium]